MKEKAKIPKLGFIGFGEAGSNLATGFREEGIVDIFAYDICQLREDDCIKVKERAKKANTQLVNNPKELAEKADIIISAVVCSETIIAAESIAPYLKEKHLYADINAAAPETKIEVEKIIKPYKAKFVDVAVMGPIPNHKHKVPIMLSGEGANEFYEEMNKFNMKLDFVEGGAGAASSVKMLRSVFMKGMAALLIEMMTSAYLFDSHKTVIKTIEKTLENNAPSELVHRLISGTAIHARRRVHEMDEVIKTVESVNMKPLMSRATRDTLNWVESMGLKEVFKG
ncbi:MAG: DUF1932 domain-containing protein, partial [Bacillota bacterium]|nr:DUF1932 domain-containing protein [Bacillota bacterium]